jgi:hypothetical protein
MPKLLLTAAEAAAEAAKLPKLRVPKLQRSQPAPLIGSNTRCVVWPVNPVEEPETQELFAACSKSAESSDKAG